MNVEELIRIGEDHIETDDAIALVRITNLRNFCELVVSIVDDSGKTLAEVIGALKNNIDSVKSNFPFIGDSIDKIIERCE